MVGFGFCASRDLFEARHESGLAGMFCAWAKLTKGSGKLADLVAAQPGGRGVCLVVQQQTIQDEVCVGAAGEDQAPNPNGLLRWAHHPENVRYCYACSKLTTLDLWPPSLHASFVTTPRRSCGVWKQARRSKSSKTTGLWRSSSRFCVCGHGCPHQRSAAN